MDSGENQVSTVDGEITRRRGYSVANTALEEIVREVLDTRPAVLAARATTAGTLDRADTTRWSLPSSARSRSRDAGSYHGRSRSLHGRLDRGVTVARNLNPQITTSDIVVSDIENVEDIEEVPKVIFQRDNELRKSSALLRHRLAERRKMTVFFERGVKTSCWADLKYVKWPKIKSRLKVVLSQELWKSHLKEVEGHFGTAVVSYFVFLRWIFIMNVVIFLLWFGMICVPQFIYQAQFNVKKVSDITCLISSPSNMTCSNESISRTSDIVYSIPDQCTGETDVIVIQECSFSDGIAVAESGTTPRSVSSSVWDSVCMTVEQNDVDYEAILANTTVYSVCIGVSAHVLWYQHILDFISGTGFFNETLLFQGVYPKTATGGYDLSLAFLFMTALIYALGVLLLVFKMGQAFNESHVEFGNTRKVNFCNKLFTAWDFNITEPKTAKLKQAHIRTDFHEELLDLHAREKKRTIKQYILVYFIRFWTNLLVIAALVGAGAAIYFSALYELQILTTGVEIPLIGEYLSAIVVSVLNATLPLAFELIARVEQYRTSTGAVRITLVRTVLVRLSSLIVLLGSLFLVISECTQPVVNSGNECSIAGFTTTTFTFNTTSTINTVVECPTCWETFIGQQFYKLGVTNLFVSFFATLLIETGRHFVSRVIVHVKWKDLGQKLGKFVTKANFNIPKSILDLIYTQSLLWLGFLFAPLLPFIVLLTSILIFYVKKYSLIWNLEPDKKGFQRSARTNFLFLFLMLLALFASVIPVLYAAVQLRPSENCGPFRNQTSMYQSVSDLVAGGSCTVRIAVDFFSSFAFIVPLIIFLILACYALYIILRAREARFQLVKKQLILEGANVTHIVGNLNDALQELAERREVPEQQPLPLSEAIKRRSHLLSKSSSIGAVEGSQPLSPATVETVASSAL